jgi:predicted lipid-binding transport protein (Tim44 family)
VLRFIALESLYSPGRGVIKRVMTALMEGITLGTLDYVPTGSATGYVAFLCLALYLVGLVLMPTILTAAPRRGGELVSIGQPAQTDELYRHLPPLRGE